MSRGECINSSERHVKIGVRERYYGDMYALMDTQRNSCDRCDCL